MKPQSLRIFKPRLFLTRKWRTNTAKDFYWPPSSTRSQMTPLIWPPRSGSQKGRQTYIQKGLPPRNKNNQTNRDAEIHTNKLHAKLGHPGEDRMHAAANYLQCIVNGAIEFCVAEERVLNPGEIIYLDLISQNKPSYRGPKNWILIQDSDTKQKWSFFTKDILEVMAEVVEEYYTYEYILTLIKYIYSIVHAEKFWFKEYIKAIYLKEWFKQCRNYPFLLYRGNKLRNKIVILYIDDTLEIGDKAALMNTIKCIKQEHANRQYVN